MATVAPVLSPPLDDPSPPPPPLPPVPGEPVDLFDCWLPGTLVLPGSTAVAGAGNDAGLALVLDGTEEGGDGLSVPVLPGGGGGDTRTGPEGGGELTVFGGLERPGAALGGVEGVTGVGVVVGAGGGGDGGGGETDTAGDAGVGEDGGLVVAAGGGGEADIAGAGGGDAAGIGGGDNVGVGVGVGGGEAGNVGGGDGMGGGGDCNVGVGGGGEGVMGGGAFGLGGGEDEGGGEDVETVGGGVVVRVGDEDGVEAGGGVDEGSDGVASSEIGAGVAEDWAAGVVFVGGWEVVVVALKGAGDDGFAVGDGMGEDAISQLVFLC